MPFDHASAAAQIAANVAEIGESWRIGAIADPVPGLMAQKERADPLGGSAYDLELSITRSLLPATLPGEGTAVANVRTDEQYRLECYRPGALGQILLVVTAALR